MPSSVVYQVATNPPNETDLLLNDVHRTAEYPRHITKIAVGGGAAVGDALVDIFIGAQFIARLPNTTTNVAFKNDEMFDLDAFVPAGATVRIMVDDGVASGQQLAVMAIFQPARVMSGGAAGGLVNV